MTQGEPLPSSAVERRALALAMARFGAFTNPGPTQRSLPTAIRYPEILGAGSPGRLRDSSVTDSSGEGHDPLLRR